MRNREPSGVDPLQAAGHQNEANPEDRKSTKKISRDGLPRPKPYGPETPEENDGYQAESSYLLCISRVQAHDASPLFLPTVVVRS